MTKTAHVSPKNILERPLEACVAFYALLTGLLFLFHPTALVAPVYDAWNDLGATVWGGVLVCVSGGHFAALWVNGRFPQLSRPVRLAACGLHLGVSLQFAANFFIAGALWGVITYAVFLPSILILVASRVMRRFLHGGDVYEL